MANLAEINQQNQEQKLSNFIGNMTSYTFLLHRHGLNIWDMHFWGHVWRITGGIFSNILGWMIECESEIFMNTSNFLKR